jgi:hypothetical protein
MRLLPSWLLKFGALTSLSAYGNYLTEVPREIGRLVQLEVRTLPSP